MANGEIQKLPSERTGRYRREDYGACSPLDQSLPSAKVSEPTDFQQSFD